MPPTLPPLMRVGITSDPLPWIHPFGLLFHRVSAKPNRNSFVFAVHKGLLSLLDFPDTNFAGPVNVTLVDVSIPSSSACFGIKHVFDQSPAWTLFLDKFVGYDTIVINQFVHLANGNGYLRHEFSKDVYNLNYATEFQATTATVTLSLQHHIRHRMPYLKLVFSHIIESLVFVGMLFFLFEFFKDRLLAFMIMSVVWLCELYSVIWYAGLQEALDMFVLGLMRLNVSSVRTCLSLTFFPPVFLSLFALFHVYFFSFPFGFSYVALWTTTAFLAQQMLFFLNRFELPALRDGVVSAQWPRQFVLSSGMHGAYTAA
ncbi:hypothetical protein DYB32_000259 [Aphanomyces invadans]|uniref:Uncharacterized protein n=1 Tax=Aphanomyces invadans TaxID=157072 RepID=A0A3R6Z686_9STRA|nr:hypothetical protein DYB32_000259 [Aphanomyces invadans]